MPLTDTEIRVAKPAEKPRRLYDTGGLYLEIFPAGGKLWRLKYRVAGKEKRLALGAYPEVGLKAARLRRDDARRVIAAGRDPGAERKAEKVRAQAEAAHIFRVVASQWLRERAEFWSQRTLDLITASLDNHVHPHIGDKPIADVTPRELRLLVKAIEATGAGETAGRVFQRLRSIFRFAVAHELVETDPTYPLKPAEIFRPRRVKHRASITERELPELLAALAAYQGDPVTVIALRLLMLTALRPGELRGGRWEELELDAKLWRVPAGRMKMGTEHLVPLSEQALSLIAELQPITGTGDLLFPSPFRPRQPFSDGTLNSALARMGFKGRLTAHGFRSLFSTAANEAGFDGDVIELQLAHEERDEVRASYNRAQRLQDRVALMRWWGGRVAAVRHAGAPTPPPAEV